MSVFILLFCIALLLALIAWVQILADVLDKPVILPAHNIDASIFGAVLLARNCLGLDAMPDLKTERMLPNKETAKQYRHIFERFKAAKF